jgi:hypothetical protein
MCLLPVKSSGETKAVSPDARIRVLQADQKGKVRSNMGTTRSDPGQGIDPAEETVFFYRCQSTALTGEVKGCGFFQLLDCTAEGKGPLVRDG